MFHSGRSILDVSWRGEFAIRKQRRKEKDGKNIIWFQVRLVYMKIKK